MMSGWRTQTCEYANNARMYTTPGFALERPTKRSITRNYPARTQIEQSSGKKHDDKDSEEENDKAKCTSTNGEDVP